MLKEIAGVPVSIFSKLEEDIDIEMVDEEGTGTNNNKVFLDS